MKHKKYLVKPGEKIKIKDFDPNDSSEFEGNKKDGKEAILKVNKEIEKLQELSMRRQTRLLVVCAGNDKAAKSVIRRFFEGVNSRVFGCPFKTPLLWNFPRLTSGVFTSKHPRREKLSSSTAPITMMFSRSVCST